MSGMDLMRTVPAPHVGRALRAVTLTVLLTGSLFPVVGGINLVLPAALLAVLLIVWEVIRTLPRLQPGLVFVLALFVILAAKGFLMAPTTLYGNEKLSRLVTQTLLCAVAATLIRDPDDVRRFAQVWLVAATLLALGTITKVTDAGQRATGFGDSNPIWLSRAIGVGVLILTWQVWNKQRRAVLALPLALLLGYGMWATGSRGPLAGTVIGLVAIAASGEAVRGKRLVGLVGLGLTGVMAVSYLPDAGSSRIVGLVADPAGDVSAAARVEMWTNTIHLIAHHPGGVGFGNWASFASPGVYLWPHDIWLEVTSEAGWLAGFALLVSLVVVTVRLARLARRDATTSLVLGMLVAESVAVSVSGDLNARTFFAFLTLGYCMSRGGYEDLGGNLERSDPKRVPADVVVGR